ncbi:MAG: hypothetical protein ABMB14_34680, partial [Myxococcota bacterium]
MSSAAPPSLSPELFDPTGLVPPRLVEVGGGLLVAAGLFDLGTAVQLAVVVDGAGATAAAALLGLLGVAAVGIGPWLYSGRGWA